jgi:hypothetical protein
MSSMIIFPNINLHGVSPPIVKYFALPSPHNQFKQSVCPVLFSLEWGEDVWSRENRFIMTYISRSWYSLGNTEVAVCRQDGSDSLNEGKDSQFCRWRWVGRQVCGLPVGNSVWEDFSIPIWLKVSPVPSTVTYKPKKIVRSQTSYAWNKEGGTLLRTCVGRKLKTRWGGGAPQQCLHGLPLPVSWSFSESSRT